MCTNDQVPDFRPFSCSHVDQSITQSLNHSINQSIDRSRDRYVESLDPATLASTPDSCYFGVIILSWIHCPLANSLFSRWRLQLYVQEVPKRNQRGHPRVLYQPANCAFLPQPERLFSSSGESTPHFLKLSDRVVHFDPVSKGTFVFFDDIQVSLFCQHNSINRQHHGTGRYQTKSSNQSAAPMASYPLQ